jgi:hypothetical protein
MAEEIKYVLGTGTSEIDKITRFCCSGGEQPPLFSGLSTHGSIVVIVISNQQIN